MGDNMSWLLVDNNCGTGAGGFKPGNTCASGKEIAEDGPSLAKSVVPSGDTISRHASYKNNLSVGYKSLNANELSLRLLEIESRLDKLGFKRAEDRQSTQDGDNLWEHPQGHIVDLTHGTNWGIRTNHLYAHVIYVPKESREGVQISREARDVTNTLLRTALGASFYYEPSGALAVDQARLSDYEQARYYHEKAIRWLNTMREDTAFKNNKATTKSLNNAIGLHAIARDWYMEKLGVQNAADNCGTGAGGFKKGNTCARGTGQIADSVDDLIGKLEVPSNTSPQQFGTIGDYPNTKVITVRGDITQTARYRTSWLEALKSIGFEVVGDTGGNSSESSMRLEHPQGHLIGIHRRSVGGEPSIQAFVTYIPKDMQEGVLITRDALQAVNRLRNDRAQALATDAMESAISLDLKDARAYHDRVIRALREFQIGVGVSRKNQIEQAIGLHRIARDWYHERLDDNWQPLGNAADNCGTGKGGFKRGNTCASGKEVATDVGELAKRLKLTGTPYVHMDNDQGMSYTLLGARGKEVQTALNQIKKQASLAGFKIAHRYNTRGVGDSNQIALEHPHGHLLNLVFQNPTDYQEGRLSAYLYFIPKQDREGLALSMEARDATATAFKGTITHLDMEAEAAVDEARNRDHKEARRYHEKMILAHTQKAGEIQVARATLGKGKVYDVDLVKLHKDAAAAHSIARDWYMERMGVQNGQWQPIGNNCGTGAGGFKPGNTCASGREVGDGTTNGAAAAIGMNKPIQLDRGVPNRVYQVFEATSKSPNDIKALKELLNSVKSLLVDNGFKAATKSGRMYEHSHGHMASISDYTNSKSLMPSFSVYFTYIPKEWREGYALTKDAHQNSLKLEDSLGPNGLLSTGLGDAEMLYGRGALTGHAGMIKLHEAAAQRAADNAKLAKAHRDAAAIHSIARDWYMDKLGIQNKAGTWNNCGTGAGGFKKGNKCARGGGVIDDTFENLREHLGVPAKATGFGKHPNVSYSLRSEIEADELRKILKSSGFALMPKRGYSIEDYDHPNGHRVTISKKDTERNYILVGVDYVPPHLQEGARLSGQAHRDSLEALQHDWGTIGIGSAADAKWAVRQGHLERAKNEHTYARDIHTREAEEMDNRGNKAAARAHRRAAESHSIARDWYMEKLGVQNRSWAKVS